MSYPSRSAAGSRCIPLLRQARAAPALGASAAGDNERQRRQVQYEKTVTELAGFWRVAFIQIPQPVLETFDATETCNEFPTPHASPKAQGSGIVAAWPSIPKEGRCRFGSLADIVRALNSSHAEGQSGFVVTVAVAMPLGISVPSAQGR